MSKKPVTVDDLRVAGEVLYGERWQTALANALKLGDSARIRQWLRGDRPIPPGIRAELVLLLRASASAASALADKLEL